MKRSLTKNQLHSIEKEIQEKMDELKRYNKYNLTAKDVIKRFNNLSRTQGLRSLASLRGIKSTRYGNLTLDLLKCEDILGQILLYPSGYGKKWYYHKKLFKERLPGGPIFLIKDPKRFLLCGWLYANELQTIFTIIFRVSNLYFKWMLYITKNDNIILFKIINPILHSENDLSKVYCFNLEGIILSQNYFFLCNYFETLLHKYWDNIYHLNTYLTIKLWEEYHPRHMTLAGYKRNYAQLYKIGLHFFCLNIYKRLRNINVDKYYNNADSMTLYVTISTDNKIILQPLNLITYKDNNLKQNDIIIDDDNEDYKYV